MTRDQHWFPAKRYGWGWGPPTVWQGWFVMAVYAAVQVLCTLVVLRDNDVVSFIVGSSLLLVALIAVCWIKGEKPRWRWGER